MSMVATSVDNPGDVVYPDCDGAPMADNPTQGRAIRFLVHGFERLFHGRPDVFVGGDFFWYPVEGQPTIVQAPDVTVIAGLPGPTADRATRTRSASSSGDSPPTLNLQPAMPASRYISISARMPSGPFPSM